MTVARSSFFQHALTAGLSVVLADSDLWAQHAHAFPKFECGYRSPAEWMADVRAAVGRGEIADPAERRLPVIPKGNPGLASSTSSCLSRSQIFIYEDKQAFLRTNYSNGQLVDFMVKAANAVLAKHGDNFDFIGYWTNFNPTRLIGTAFYKYIVNDVRGIGDPSTKGTPIFNLRPALGLGGKRIQGFVQMWNIRSSHWQAGTGAGANFTRLALAQEFEHRWAMYLPDLKDGRRLQGFSGCGRVFHWNWRVDGQGSGMEIAEWVGTNPAVPRGTFVQFNSDIPGGVFSYTDLYLMGYVSPAEMDAGSSELRFMETADCRSSYFGKISPFSSKEIIASAGARVPDFTKAQKEFRTAWIMIHLPGAPPTTADLDKAVAILAQHEMDWRYSTLGRGSMDDSLFGTCAKARVYGCGVNPLGSMKIVSGDPAIGGTVTLGVDNPLKTQRSGAVPFLFLAASPDSAFPCGTHLAGFGMRSAAAPGELLIGAPALILAGAPWQQSPALFRLSIPGDNGLIGTRLWGQGLLVDPANPAGIVLGLADGVALRIGS